MVSGAFDATQLTLQVQSSMALVAPPTVTAYQEYHKVPSTHAVAMAQVGPTHFEGAMMLTNGTRGLLEISCQSTDGQTLDTFDAFSLYAVNTNANRSQSKVTPSKAAQALDTAGLLIEGNGPVILPPGHVLPTNQVGTAYFTALQDDLPLDGTNTVNLSFVLDETDLAALDETTLQVARWDGPGNQWLPASSSHSPGSTIVSMTVSNAGVYVLLADATGDTTPPAAISDLIAAPGAFPWTTVLQWTAPGDDGNTGAAAVYELMVDTEAITTDTWDRVAAEVLHQSPLAAGSAESTEQTLEEPGVEYFFALRAKDEAGNLGPLSNLAVARSTIVDSDGDGMRDDWEDRNGLDPTTIAGEHGADKDPDLSTCLSTTTNS